MWDDGESTDLFEPLRVSTECDEHRLLVELAARLDAQARAVTRSLPAPLVDALAHAIVVCESLYSNRIEGHHLPLEALVSPGDEEVLRQEALALVATHEEGLFGEHGDPWSSETLSRLHRAFFSRVPESLRLLPDEDGRHTLVLVPGALRRHGVAVGRHVAVSPGSLPRFLARMDAVYGRSRDHATYLDVAAAHHRFLWVHPFGDGYLDSTKMPRSA